MSDDEKRDEFGVEKKNYKTKYIGHSFDPPRQTICGVLVGADEDIRLDEYCYGYDPYSVLRRLGVYKTSGKKAVKYAMTEITNNVYGFWEIIE